MPKISVIIPVYNVELFIERCIKSVCNQTYSDFEIIIVDDGSFDYSSTICDDFLLKDHRIIVIHKENGGVSDARNKGLLWSIENSNSTWVAFIDSDDWIHKQYLSILLSLNISNNTLISSCEAFFTKGSDFFNNELCEEICKVSEVLSSEDFYVRYCLRALHVWGKLYKKQLLENIRFPFGIIHEDVFFSYKALFLVGYVSVTKNELYAYFSAPGSIMRKNWTTERLVAFDIYDGQLKFFKENNYYDAYKRCVVLIAETYCDQINQLQIENSGNKKIDLLLRNRLRYHLKKYKNLLKFSIRNYPYFYSKAYPLFSYLFWLFDSQLNKIRRKKWL